MTHLRRVRRFVRDFACAWVRGSALIRRIMDRFQLFLLNVWRPEEVWCELKSQSRRRGQRLESASRGEKNRAGMTDTRADFQRQANKFEAVAENGHS